MTKLSDVGFCLGCFILALLLTGCGSTSGTLSKEPVSFVRISGVTGNQTAIIDELPAVPLDPEIKPCVLQLRPGKHRIRILRDQTTQVDRVVLISDQQTIEISVP